MKKSTFKKVMACVCSLALAGALMPATAITAFADDSTDVAFTVYAQDAATGTTTTVATYTEQQLADLADNYPTLSYTYAKGVYSTSNYVEMDAILSDVEQWTDGSYVQFECLDGSYTKWTYTYEYAESSKYFYPNNTVDDSGNIVADSQSAYEVPDVLALNSQSTGLTVGSKLMDLIDVSEASTCSIFFTGVETDGSSNAGRLMPQDVEGITIVYKHVVTDDDVSISAGSYTYDGTAKTPAVTVKAADGTTLEQTSTVEGTDDDGNATTTTTENYTVAYSGNTNAGTATVTVTIADSNEAYTGTIAKTFTIAKASQSLNVTKKAVKAKSTKKTTGLKAITKVSGAKGTVTYKKTSGNKKITVNAKTGKITVKKGLKKGKTYKVNVKVTSAKTANYSAASKTVTIKVKVK